MRSNRPTDRRRDGSVFWLTATFGTGGVLAGAAGIGALIGSVHRASMGLGRLKRRERWRSSTRRRPTIHEAPANRSALARAMLSFTDAPASDGSVGIDPARVDHLLGKPPSWRFPTLMFLLAVFLLALLAAVAVLAGQEAAGPASLAPPFLSAQPCVVVLALIPAGVGLVGITVVRFKRAGRAILASPD